ncbi:hypothetical protein MPNT_480001 [Candidatus Methylacidithermus pantelleriae]|uniref:Uncharacterized protein n=1 Tax=Candidatus Methylacidithermus pantelleriae TaxID=2744239 RepID=A0A8J2BK87_9BACT|nr:hypothetical protein MPNT_480001 [Candidatus Methylacidithermus pantelleriae]
MRGKPGGFENSCGVARDTSKDDWGSKKEPWFLMEERKSPWKLGSAHRRRGFRMSLKLREAKLQEPLSASSQKIESFGLATGVKGSR